jgi:caffeoyl-CoA O-methyltransferase
MASNPDVPWLDAAVVAYVAQHSTPKPDAVLSRLITDTGALGPRSIMQIDAQQGAAMSLLVGLTGARFAVEVGTFTGYSSICIARALAPGGRLLCCDVSEEWTAMARHAWEEAGLTDRIELRIAPALDTLRSLPDTEHIDVAFIDADKPSYAAYYDELLRRLRPGGLIMVDNVLWSRRVLDPQPDDADTVALAAFNDMVASDDRVDVVMLPIADGLSLIRKRSSLS